MSPLPKFVSAPITISQAVNMIDFGKSINVKVTCEVRNGRIYMRFRRVRTDEHKRAMNELRHMALDIPANWERMVG